MYTPVIVLVFLAAVFNGVPSTEGSLWSWVISEVGNLEKLNTSDMIVEVNYTKDELKELVFFDLWTDSNPETADIVYLDDDDTLSASNFNASNPTRIVIHGWQSSCEKLPVTGIRDAYIALGDHNVIGVDWSAIADKDYVYARSRIATVGEYVGLMIDYLEEQGMSLDDLTVMGHSLGAHVAGVACRTATNTVAHLIGMDPAGPLFYANDQYAKITKTDAAFVQIIHTNAGYLGYNGNLGDVDFWPNGGEWQAGCTLDVFGICSHRKSYLFVTESITSSSTSDFVAYACDSYESYTSGACSSNATSYIGGSTLDTSASGVYYLDTNSASTYAKGV